MLSLCSYLMQYALYPCLCPMLRASCSSLTYHDSDRCSKGKAHFFFLDAPLTSCFLTCFGIFVFLFSLFSSFTLALCAFFSSLSSYFRPRGRPFSRSSHSLSSVSLSISSSSSSSLEFAAF